MYVKRLDEREVLDALHLAGEVFTDEVAPSYPPQGIEEFQNFIRYENMLPRVQSREMAFFAVMEGLEMCGMAAIRRDGHISLLFVRKKWQRQGAARRLFHAMQQYCVIERRLVRMSVNAAPNAVEAYRHLGFMQMAEMQEQDGISSVPMEYLITDAKDIAGGLNTLKKRKRKTTGILLLGLALFLLISGVCAYFTEKIMDEFQQTIEDQQNNSNNQTNIGNTENEEDGSDEKETGIEAIDAYIAENLSYTIEEEEYTYYSDGNNKEYPMQFVVKYPQIKGLNSEMVEEINAELKACAMSTVEVLYLNPSESTKEAMLQLQSPVLASNVTYKVTYASDDFISVVFNDVYYAGSGDRGYVDLRTRNISLEDGKLYEVKDITELSDAFMRSWKSKMDGEAPNVNVLKDLRTSDFRKILNGEVLEGNYFQAFFLDKDGVEIGFTYHHTSGNQAESGWITAPFTYEEIKELNPENTFWTEMFENK